MSTQIAADVVVVDYGLGNLRSVTRGLERAGAGVEISTDPSTLDRADGIVLPGVGAFSEGMENAGPFRDALSDAAADGTPLFGICLGMQMLMTSSEESERVGQGDVKGLDLIPGKNVRFSDVKKVPHMGWNELTVKREHPLVEGVDGQYAYFVHSYYAKPENEERGGKNGDQDGVNERGNENSEDTRAVVTTTDYGHPFPSIVANEDGTVFGTQFHPEKSGETGLRILKNFVDFCG